MPTGVNPWGREINTRNPLRRGGTHRQCSQRAKEKHERLEDPAARRGLQEGCGRFARIAVAQDHAAPPAARRSARLQRPLFPATPQDASLQLRDRKSTRLNSSHGYISYAVFCLKKKKKKILRHQRHR